MSATQKSKMPASDSEAITLSILEREFKIACPPAQKPLLLRVASQLDQRMRQIRAGDKLLTLDRVAVLAALMMAMESGEQDGRLDELNESIGGALKRLNAQLASAAVALDAPKRVFTS
jgi:cell division protein ZapA